MNKIRILSAILLLSALAGCSSAKGTDTPAKAQKIIKIAGAADLQPAFEELGRQFNRETGIKTVFTFGSSGQLSQQISQGMKMDLFFSADEGYVDKVIAAGRGLKTKNTYALGRLVIITGKVNEEIHSIVELAFADTKKVAIANPDHAPYGRAAKEALQKAGIWKQVQPKLIMGENARQAFQYAETGNVDRALIPLSLALSANRKYSLVPAETHQPIKQTVVMIAGGNQEAASKFLDLLTSKKGQEVMKKYGFEKP